MYFKYFFFIIQFVEKFFYTLYNTEPICIKIRGCTLGSPLPYF